MVSIPRALTKQLIPVLRWLANSIEGLRHVALLDIDPNIDAGLVRARQLQEVSNLTPWMMATNIANSTIIFFFLWRPDAGWGLALWSTSICLLSVKTLHSWIRHRHLPPRTTVTTQTIVRAIRNAGLLGLLWGLLPFIVLTQEGITEQILTTNVIAGMSAGGAFALAAIPMAAFAYLGLMLGPALTAVWTGHIPASMALFAMGVIYFSALTLTIIARYREFSKRISYQFHIQKQKETISLLLKDFESSASDWLWETDPEGNLTYVSDRLVYLTGQKKNALLGKPITASAGAHSETAPWIQVLDHMRKGEPIRDHVVSAQTAHGPAWWSITAGPILQADGTATGYRGVGTDITERIRAEKARAEQNTKLAAFNAQLERKVAERTQEAEEAAERAQEASRAKSVFLASMSHEIRTPMNGVLGMTDLLIRSDLTTHQRRLVNTINQSGLTLLALINDILDHSRIEAGKLELDLQDFDLRACVEGAMEILSEEAHRKSLEMTLLMPPTLPTSLFGDASRLRQVLVNLIGNAVKFTSEGQVCVRVWSSGKKNGKIALSFSVMDTGIGISPEAQKILFNPFAQADSSITRRFGGTGLGLSISHSLVRMMGGEMTLASKPGEGTTVSFEIALAQGQSTSDVSSEDRKLANDLRVLVVDDRKANCEVINCYLSEMGAQPQNAANGHEALEKIKAAQNAGTPYSLAIIDMIMPGMNGLELARRIREDSQTHDTRLILLTSLSWKGDRQTSRKHGISEFLSKPVRYRELVDAVESCMSGSPPAVTRRPKPDQTIEKDKYSGMKVLLAEDNLVNQEVMREYASALGCQIAVADNGREAVDLFSKGAFDIVLMDCQMPEMDGLTACRKIRDLERSRNSHRTPVVAVTANAYESDRLMCMEAEMDDVLTKPCKLSDIAATLDRWGSHTDSQQANGKNGQPTSTECNLEDQVFDPSPIQSMEECSTGAAVRLVDLYLSTAPKLVRQILTSIADKDRNAVGTAAHSLKSSSASIGAMRMAQLAKRIETAAREKTAIPEILLIASKLEGALSEVEVALERAPWTVQACQETPLQQIAVESNR